MDPTSPRIIDLQEIKVATRAGIADVLTPPRKHIGSGTWVMTFALSGALLLSVGSSIPLLSSRNNQPQAEAIPVAWARPEIVPLTTEERNAIRERTVTREVPHYTAPVIEEQDVPILPQNPGLAPWDSFSSETSSAVSLPEETSSSSESSASEMPQSSSSASSEASVSSASSDSSASSSEESSVSSSDSSAPEARPVPKPKTPRAPATRFIPAQVGVFLTEGSVKNRKYLIETLDHLKSTTGAALIFNVKGSAVYFDSDAPLAKELNLIRPAFDLKEVIALARERGIYTMGRFIVVKDPSLARALPETQIRHPKTGRSVGAVWVDPSNASVITYNKEILEDLVESGIDEVNFDYIRYPTEYAQAAVGLTGQEKADHLEQFIRVARTVINQNGGKTKLGISTYAILGWNFPVNFEYVGQDIARFAPFVDVISPMAYPATFAEGAYYNPAKHPRSRMYYLVYRTLTGYAELLGPDAYKLRPWIQGYGITTKNLKDEIDAVFDAGACGFTIWNASNSYDLFYAASDSVRRPESCGK